MNPSVVMILVFFAVVGNQMLAVWKKRHTCVYCGTGSGRHSGGCPYEGIDWRNPNQRL